MANEITQVGQLIVYGGPPLTLTGSKVGSDAASILARVGTGTARGWKLFDSSKASFLNTLTTINDGDIVLVNAKFLPMDFPVKVGAVVGSSWYDVFDVPAGSGSVPTLIRRTLRTSGFSYANGVFKDSSNAVVAGTYSFRLDEGPVLSEAAFNAAVAAIPLSEIKSGLHDYFILATVPSNVAATLSLQLL